MEKADKIFVIIFIIIVPLIIGYVAMGKNGKGKDWTPIAGNVSAWIMGFIIFVIGAIILLVIGAIVGIN